MLLNQINSIDSQTQVKMFALYAVFFTLYNSTSGQDNSNVFTNHEPKHWPALFPQCGGKSQSPIDLHRYFLPSRNLTKLKFLHGYSQEIAGTFQNNGFAVKYYLASDSKADVIINKKSYRLCEIHFHWGANLHNQTLPGSEHTLDGQRFAVEMQLLHSEQSLNDTTILGTAVIAVIGNFLRATPDLTDGKAYQAYKILFNLID